MQVAASVVDFFKAVFTGAPDPESAAKYTAQVTAAISLYLCFVAVFLVGLYVRSVERDARLEAERKTFKVWIAYSLIFSILIIAAYVGYFLFAAR